MYGWLKPGWTPGLGGQRPRLWLHRIRSAFGVLGAGQRLPAGKFLRDVWGVREASPGKRLVRLRGGKMLKWFDDGGSLEAERRFVGQVPSCGARANGGDKLLEWSSLVPEWRSRLEQNHLKILILCGEISFEAGLVGIQFILYIAAASACTAIKYASRTSNEFDMNCYLLAHSSCWIRILNLEASEIQTSTH